VCVSIYVYAAGEEGADAFQCRAPRAAACARARASVKPQAAEACAGSTPHGWK
jgi:hypothetical protein